MHLGFKGGLLYDRALLALGVDTPPPRIAEALQMPPIIMIKAKEGRAALDKALKKVLGAEADCRLKRKSQVIWPSKDIAEALAKVNALEIAPSGSLPKFLARRFETAKKEEQKAKTGGNSVLKPAKDASKVAAGGISNGAIVVSKSAIVAQDKKRGGIDSSSKANFGEGDEPLYKKLKASPSSTSEQKLPLPPSDCTASRKTTSSVPLSASCTVGSEIISSAPSTTAVSAGTSVTTGFKSSSASAPKPQISIPTARTASVVALYSANSSTAQSNKLSANVAKQIGGNAGGSSTLAASKPVPSKITATPTAGAKKCDGPAAPPQSSLLQVLDGLDHLHGKPQWGTSGQQTNSKSLLLRPRSSAYMSANASTVSVIAIRGARPPPFYTNPVLKWGELNEPSKGATTLPKGNIPTPTAASTSAVAPSLAVSQALCYEIKYPNKEGGKNLKFQVEAAYSNCNSLHASLVALPKRLHIVGRLPVDEAHSKIRGFQREGRQSSLFHLHKGPGGTSDDAVFTECCELLGTWKGDGRVGHVVIQEPNKQRISKDNHVVAARRRAEKRLRGVSDPPAVRPVEMFLIPPQLAERFPGLSCCPLSQNGEDVISVIVFWKAHTFVGDDSAMSVYSKATGVEPVRFHSCRADHLQTVYTTDLSIKDSFCVDDASKDKEWKFPEKIASLAPKPKPKFPAQAVKPELRFNTIKFERDTIYYTFEEL